MRYFVLFLSGCLLCFLCLSCSDDNGSGATGSPSSEDSPATKADRAQNAIDEVEDAIEATMDARCTCALANTGEDIQACIDELKEEPTVLNTCQRVAVGCDINSYLSFQNCQRDQWQALADCLSTCPDYDSLSACLDEFDDAGVECEMLFSQELLRAWQACSNNQTPDCSDLSGDPGSGASQCISPADFIAHTANRPWAVFYGTGTGGALECEDSDTCVREQLEFYEDGSYALMFTTDVGLSSQTMICASGTWQIACDTLILTDCIGTDSGKLNLMNDGFMMGARHFTTAGLYIDPKINGNCSTTPCR